MKALKNPVVVGVLAVVALGVVINSVMPKKQGSKPKSGADKTAVAAPAKTKKSKAPAFIEPDVNMDAAQAGWLAVPERDPFGSRKPAVQAAAKTTEAITSPVPTEEVLQLSAIWMQDAARPLAILNGKIVGEGDTVKGFRVERILTDQILVAGTRGLASVRFPGNPPPPVTDPSKPAAAIADASLPVVDPNEALSVLEPLLKAADALTKAQAELNRR